ncbi:hypothetical protein Pmar_PMAR007925 [Perkinsus marinus ATCC 50983]|uniref:Uncharacterized protein n=1 Tax=Perkinsus marinus (strain ATCC 50983 / TXsc) TaxID=423536 RepID=C5L4R3_PERM5|nr:hypothetical protein Pmar_PMAR007925 [Perkinsus marinus ATCC 50983]EER08254.1 hypothetical protein Pmar_PMAR007925 [Perkinsus marinus ATCC 50983]|eukprot:XP_002776438.1 hypothetical protein Pmar_PMAR007925 [Perkinsus marinus ATCC 50983]
MVTAVDIDTCNTRSGLAKLRSTCRRQRTIRLKELVAVQEQLSSTDILSVDDEQREQLAVTEAALEEEVAAYVDLVDRCTAKINKLLSETQAPVEGLSNNPSDQMELLVSTITDAFQRVAPSTTTTSITTKSGSRVPSLGDVVKFNVTSRTLKDIYLLPLQYRRLESLFLSAGFGELVPTANGKDEFQPHPTLRVPLIEKLLETLAPHSTLLSEATRLIDLPSIGYDWQKVKKALVEKYCSPVEMRKEVLRRATQLTFSGPSGVNRFVDQVRDLRSLHLISLRNTPPEVGDRRATSDDSTEPIDVTAHFVDLALRPLPNNIMTELIKEVTAVARQSYPERRNWEWQRKLPLDGGVGTSTILGLLTELCYAHNFTTESKKPKSSTPNNQNSNASDVRDKLWHTSDQRSSTANNQQKAAHAEAVSWAKSQPYVLLVMGDGVKGATPSTAGFSEATELKFLTSKGGKPYCLLSFGDKARALNCVSEYFNDKTRFGVVKEFDTNYKRNSRHGPRQPKNGGGSGGHQ